MGEGREPSRVVSCQAWSQGHCLPRQRPLRQGAGCPPREPSDPWLRASWEVQTPAALAAKAEFRLQKKPQVQPLEERQKGGWKEPHLRA